ncbi:MAG: F0F1 ATP synthase subunit B [Candidatus Promineifilaceae bacterium]|nr:F0F1 ATP synthase subunit B [Candidatus Promineifilaceae bacterium]
MEGLGINLGYLIIQILGLIVLILLMRAFAYDPILRLLQERQARIAKGLEDARQAAIARDNADAEAKKILEAARSEAAKIRSDATVQAEETADGITSQAEEEAKQILAEAREEAQEERDRILADLRTQVGDIAMAAANKLVGQSLTEKRQHEIIQDFFAEVPEGVKQMKGEKATVTSALPLTDQEKEAARKALKVEQVEFRVNPDILGGLVVRVGDQVVDDSVAGQMSTLREALRR